MGEGNIIFKNKVKIEGKEEIEGSNRIDDIATIINSNINIMERLAGCDVTIIYDGKQYGNQSNTQAPKAVGGMEVLSKFRWHGCLGYVITNGIILFWTQESAVRRDSNVLELAARQSELLISNYTMSIKLREMATVDELTKIYNRRYFMERLNTSIDNVKRYGGNTGLILIDVDNFKSYNDSFGHPEGDKLLKELGAILKNSIRTTDTVGRLGGEEFGVLMSNVNTLEEVREAAERIRRQVQSELNQDTGKSMRQVTISLGAAIYNDKTDDQEELYKEADRKLYKAKDSGRNRTEV